MNRPDNLYPCLESIRRETKAACETFVVAYMFSAENLSRAKADFPWVEFIESCGTRGFSENNNLALRRVRGEYCFILNDDTELRGDCISRLLADFGRLPADAAIVTPRLVNADGSLQLCGRPRYPALCYLLQQWHLYSEPIENTRRRKPVFDRVYRTYNISGASFLIKTEIFRGLGWFDERYFFTPEDIALGTLARRRGYGIYVDSDAEVMHKWRTTASRLSPAVRPAAVRGSLIFFSRGRKWRYLALGAGVWLSETLKKLKASVRLRLEPTEENRIKYLTFKHIAENIFTRESPKEIFSKYYGDGK